MTYLVERCFEPRFSVTSQLNGEIPEELERLAIRGEPLPKDLQSELPTGLTLGANETAPIPILRLSHYAVVVDGFADLLEQFEPGVHVRSPIDIYLPSGQRYPTPYYMIFPGNHINAVVIEKSNVIFNPHENSQFVEAEGQRGYYSINTSRFKLTIDSSLVKDCHCWLSSPPLTRDTFFQPRLVTP